MDRNQTFLEMPVIAVIPSESVEKPVDKNAMASQSESLNGESKGSSFIVSEESSQETVSE